MRFFDYIKIFVNSYFKHLYQNQIENKNFKKQFYKEINLVKNDIINKTLTCDEKYHSWLNENRYKIVPEIFEISYYYDIKVTPYKYLNRIRENRKEIIPVFSYTNECYTKTYSSRYKSIS
jgi:hypothetical protein